MEDLLGPARLPRKPTNLVERGAGQQVEVRRRIRAKENRVLVVFLTIDRMGSIGRDPLVYIGGWSYPSRKHP